MQMADKHNDRKENIMEQNNIISETNERLKAYAEALMRCGLGDEPYESLSIVRQGNAVGITRYTGETIQFGVYQMPRPALVRKHIDRQGIEFEGVRYNTIELQLRNGEDVQVVKIGDMLHVFDLDGKGIVSIKI